LHRGGGGKTNSRWHSNPCPFVMTTSKRGEKVLFNRFAFCFGTKDPSDQRVNMHTTTWTRRRGKKKTPQVNAPIVQGKGKRGEEHPLPVLLPRGPISQPQSTGPVYGCERGGKKEKDSLNSFAKKINRLSVLFWEGKKGNICPSQ